MLVVNKTFTIASGASLSDAIDISEAVLVGIKLPSTWTAANLTIQAADEDAESTFNNVYDQTGTEVTITASASRHVILEPAKFAGMKQIKLRSGTSGTPVNQAAGRTIVAYLARE